MSFARGTGYCFLDVFRPGPKQRLEWAVFSTYSLDLVALVALLMELADVEGEGLDAGDVPFIQAIESLTGKVSVVCQHGRISFPKTSAHRILVLLDRFVCKATYDERQHSWHAKVGLAKYARADGGSTIAGEATEWRLWLGSRNLTQNTDWEAGIALVGRPARSRERPSDIPGLSSALEALLVHVRATHVPAATEMAEINRLVWRAPIGVTLESIAFCQGNDRPVLLAPPPSARFRSITAAAPFVDVGGLNAIVSLPLVAGKSERTIVTTRVQLSRQSLVNSAAVAGVTLRLMAPPSEEGTMALADLPPSAEEKAATVFSSAAGDGIEGNAVAGEEGIHAKLVLARGMRKGANILWIGSANLTGRGLDGRNAEIVARLRVPDEVADSLEKFVSGARSFDPKRDSIEETDADRANRELNERRNALVADVAFKLVFEGKRVKLVGDRVPLDGKAGFALWVALLSTPRNRRSWPTGATELVLAEDLPKKNWTDMIAFELVDSVGHSTSWILPVEAEGFDSITRRERNDAAIVDYLGHERAVLWIQAAVAGKPGVSDWTWDGRRRVVGRPTHKRPGFFGVTLETMLASWARDPDALSTETKDAITARMEILRRSLQEDGAQSDDKRDADRKALERFSDAWRVLLDATARAGR